MKNITLFILALFLGVVLVSAQVPQSLRYQAVVRDNSGNVLANQSVSFRISILNGSDSEAMTYRETHTGLSTNAFGLVELEIGKGKPVNGTFSAIDWGSNSYFVKIEIDPSGGKSYKELITSQLLSVPYALHAKTAENGITAAQTEAILANTAKTSYPSADATKLAGIATGAEVNVNADWNAATGDAQILNKPIIPSQYTDAMADARVTAGITNKVDKETGKGLSTNGTAAGQMQYWNGSAWVNVAPGATGQILTFVNGVPTWQKPTIPNVGSTDVYNHATGKVWMDRNLGATQVATSSTDANAYGDLYQWGRAADGHQIRTSGITTILSSSDTPGHGNFILAATSIPYDWRSPQNNNLWQGVSGTNNPCPAGYRLPTAAEWSNEMVSWPYYSAAAAFASPLKLPVAGYRDGYDSSLMYVGFEGSYWSSTVDGIYSRYVTFYKTTALILSASRANGKSVRCIKD